MRLLSEKQRGTTTVGLAAKMARGDKVAERAIEILKDLRSTGVKSSRRQQREQEEAASQHFWKNEPSALEETPAGGVSGTARPKVKSFRRID
jgi:hypothetical protein